MRRSPRPDWASDGPVSIPDPPSGEIYSRFAGWCFSAGGIHHDISEADVEELSNPPIAPYTE